MMRAHVLYGSAIWWIPSMLAYLVRDFIDTLNGKPPATAMIAMMVFLVAAFWPRKERPF